MRLAIAVLAALLGINGALASTSIVPKASGSAFTLDMALDSVTNNNRQATYLMDPATGLLITPFQSGMSIGNASFGISGTLPAFASTPTVNVGTMPTVAVTGTFWQATQPVSGTFWQATQPVSIASMPSTPVTGTFWQATQPVSAASLPLPTGAALETGGNLATIAGAVSSSVEQTNEKQINGVAPLMGNGISGTGSQRVNIASDNTAFTVNAAQSGTWTVGTAAADACQAQAHNFTPISIATATTTKIATGVSAKKIYICSLYLLAGSADNVAIIEGTTATTCGTAPLGVVGGATAATGNQLAANQGFVLSNGGYAVAAASVNNNDVCIITSAAVQLSGVAVWVTQ